MKEIHLQTSRPVVPMIYAYTTPEIERHSGWLKIGDTEQAVGTRIEQQTHTADVEQHIEWSSEAVFGDGSGKTFRDHDFHRYLQQNGIERKPGTEWFHIDPDQAFFLLAKFKQHKGFDPRRLKSESIPYTLRPEQVTAVDNTAEYFRSHSDSKYLWNAKPRFGKTLAVYEMCRKLGAEHVLIVTNRPVVATSWYNDYVKFVRGWNEGWMFASDSPELEQMKRNSPSVPYYFVSTDSDLLTGANYFMFVSLQDLKGSKYFGGKFDKLKYVTDTHWDVLVIDESHEGVNTFKTDTAFNYVHREHTLYLSGTPFKALASNEFAEDQIFNWTYTDEQEAKEHWRGEGRNPYEEMPRLNLFTYRMSDIVRDQVEQGLDINGETEEYAFDLNECFRTNESGHFVHLDAVKQFIKALTTQKKFPFSTPELRNELKHTLWLLDRVDSAKELIKLLRVDPVFENYTIIPAVGDGKVDDSDDNQKSFEKVMEAIHGNPEKGIEPADRTITVSVGQLTTGVTVPEWTGVLILSNIESSALYMQAAFRAQNPYLGMQYSKKERTRVYLRKKNAYVFDFDPARTLDIYEQFANGLYSSTASGNGTTSERKEHIRELLNFFPVLGEDENGEMIQLNAEQVLSVPRKIRSQEVVKRGFMSNFLFQNISNIFGAPKEVMDIINQFPVANEPKKNEEPLPDNPGEGLDLNEYGEIAPKESLIIGTAADIFGEKKYGTSVNVIVGSTLGNPGEQDVEETHQQLYQIKKAIHEQVVQPLIETAQQHFGNDMHKSDCKSLNSIINNKVDAEVERKFTDFNVQQSNREAERKEELNKSDTAEQDAAINEKYNALQKQAEESFGQDLVSAINTIVSTAQTDAVRHVETAIQQRKKDSVEDEVRGRLRGFARTIPSFLMAYGSDAKITLENFDAIVPDNVFIEVTSISLEQFRFLRDGGDYQASDGTIKHYPGHLFDGVVFNDSVTEFMNLKNKLANYFDETNQKDIFDYIPPQKTNQIFTPRKVVMEMVDMLEKENPGCFDRDDVTFADLYMKSGMYITEIVKRLYNSPRLQELYPDPAKRLNHIFAKQVYGLAPTEIIYRICLSYILGFSDKITIEKNNIRKCDALECAKNGTLEAELESLFPDLHRNDNEAA